MIGNAGFAEDLIDALQNEWVAFFTQSNRDGEEMHFFIYEFVVTWSLDNQTNVLDLDIVSIDVDLFVIDYSFPIS